MLSFVSVALACAFAATSVEAHGGVLAYSIAGKWYEGWRPYNSPAGQSTIQRPWATFDPIQNPMASTVSCNNDGNSGPAQLTATVAAGQSITAYWNQVWPHPQGPMLTYLAQCPGSSCTGVNSNSLKWFKIDHAGLVSGTVGSGTWAAGRMIANNNTWTSTIPSSVPSGHYLIRFETIALHSLPAQLYPECAQIQITGGGSRAPTASELVSFPGGYKSNEPGLIINIYSSEAQSMTNYPIPGPPLYGSGSTNPPTSTTSTTSTTTTTTTTTTPNPTPTGTVPQYQQCGGIGYTGATGCISPYTCKKINDYYFQCL